MLSNSKSNGFIGKFLLYVPVKLLPAFLTVFFIFFLYRFFPGNEYVAYSVSVSCSLIVAQLSAMWVGNSYVYYYSGVTDKRSFLSSCLYLVLIISPFAALVAAIIASFFSSVADTFFCVALLCFTQMLFFFMSSVCQAAFLVRQQLMAVLAQLLVQLGVIYFCYQSGSVSYRDAMIALSGGYGAAAAVMLSAVVMGEGLNGPWKASTVLWRDIRSVYNYGAALMPWMLGMLLMLAVDRFSVGYLGLSGGESYLSMKDLFVGVGGLVSMPLLMLVHPLIMKRFREGAFDGALIHSSIGFLIIVFTLLWAVIEFVGFAVFEYFTGKSIVAPMGVLIIAYLGVFLNCAAVYVQKRLEVHRRLRLLAITAIFAAVLSAVFSFLGGLLFGLYGVALGVVVGQFAYFAIVSTTIVRKVDWYEGCVKPLLVAVMAIIVGYLLRVLIDVPLSSAAWWVKAAVWTLLFSLFSLVLMWKAISWKDFINAKLN
ncbi:MULTISPECIES: sugar transporter [unclassified Pseudomonas]|uniref:sugar transporter n=1 Tax=unclassified Pseudomonas TaxID=196821 RepID=UPI003FA26943